MFVRLAIYFAGEVGGVLATTSEFGGQSTTDGDDFLFFMEWRIRMTGSAKMIAITSRIILPVFRSSEYFDFAGGAVGPPVGRLPGRLGGLVAVDSLLA